MKRPPQYRMPLLQPHDMYPDDFGTQCVACWGWVDDPRHLGIKVRVPTDLLPPSGVRPSGVTDHARVRRERASRPDYHGRKHG